MLILERGTIYFSREN